MTFKNKRPPEGTEYSMVRKHSHDSAQAYLKKTGYARGGEVKTDGEEDMEAPGIHGKKHGGEVAEDKKLIAKAVHKHEKHDHPGKKMTKLKDGGHVEGKKAHHRADRYARGGHVKGKAGTKVNVIVAPGEAKPAGDPRAAAIQAAMMAKTAPAGVNPAMANGPIPAGSSMPPQAPRPMAKRGGAIHENMQAGSKTGEGRMEKIADEKRFLAARRKRGGKC